MRTLFFAFIILISFSAVAQEIELTYYSSGSLATYEERINPLVVAYSSFYEDGALKERGFYYNGLPHGEWKQYTSAGELECHAMYNKGDKAGVWYFLSQDNISFTQVSYIDNQVYDVSLIERERLKTIQN